MNYPKYGIWCKKNVIETIKKQKIHDSENYLAEFVFNPDSDLYSSGVYDYEVCDILWSINNELDYPQKALFSTVQHGFAEKYFQMAQEMNPEADMKMIRRNDVGCTNLMYRTLEGMTIGEIKDAVMYAFDYGTEEIEEPKIPYIKTSTVNIANVVQSGLTKIESIHINYLNPYAENKNIPTELFTDYLLHLSRSGIFADTIRWRYVDMFEKGTYLLEGDISHNNGYELNVSIVTKDVEDRNKVVEMLGKAEE